MALSFASTGELTLTLLNDTSSVELTLLLLATMEMEQTSMRYRVASRSLACGSIHPLAASPAGRYGRS